MVSSLETSARWRALESGASAHQVAKAWRAGLRDAGRAMRTATVRHVRDRKRLRARTVREAIRLRRESRGLEVVISGRPVPLAAYPHRQTARGVTANINRGAATRLPGAFTVTFGGGHYGVFRRVGRARLPIREVFTSTVADVVRDTGVPEGLLTEGTTTFFDTFSRVLALEEK